MRALLLASVSMASLSLALGCSSDEPKRRPSGTFEPDRPKTNHPAVFLRGRQGTGERLLVDVVANGLDRDLHGAAFRLHWDPTRLGWSGAQGSDAWSRQ